MVPISRKRDRNVLEDDDGIVMNLSMATTGTVNTPKKTAKGSQQQEEYSTPDADTSTSFLGRAFSVATSVFKRRKIFSSSHEKEKHTSDNTATAVDNKEDEQLTKLGKQQKPSLPLLHRKTVQLDTSKNETSVDTTKANNTSRLLFSSTGPPSTIIPFQSPMLQQQQQRNLQQAMRTNALERISQQGSSSSSSLLFSIGRTAPKSLEFSNGRIQPKSQIFLKASSSKKQEHRRKDHESATAIAKRILESLEEQDLRSLVPPPKATTSQLKQKFVLGGLESYSSRLPGSHPFAPPAPPPNKHTPQILRPDTRSAPYIEQEPRRLPMGSPEAIVQINNTFLLPEAVTPILRQFPSKEQVKQHLRNLRKSYKPSHKLLMKQLIGDDNEEFDYTHEDDDIEVANQVILYIVNHQNSYDSDHIISSNIDADILISVLKQKPTSLPELKPKTTQGDAWWNNNGTNNNKYDQLASSSCLPYPLLSFGETTSKTEAISVKSKEKDPEVNRSVTTDKWDSHMFPKAGQWRCSNCFSLNDSTKNKCVACDGPIEKKGRTETWGPHMYPKAGQWKCSSCFSHNDSTKIKCAACDTLKEKTATNGIVLNNSGGFFFGSPAPTTDANNKGVINVNTSSSATTSNTTEEAAPPAKDLNIDKSTGSSLRTSTADPLAVPNNAQQMFGLLPSSGGFKFVTSSSGSTTAATNTTETAPLKNFNDSTNAISDTSAVASTFSRPSSDGMLFLRPKDSTAASSAAADATAPSATFKFGTSATTPAPNASTTAAARTSTLFGYNSSASAQTNAAATADSVAFKLGNGTTQVSDAPAPAAPSSTSFGGDIFNNAQSNIETTIGASTSKFRSGITVAANTPTVPSTASFGGTASINTEVKAAAKTDPTGPSAGFFIRSDGTNSTSTQVRASPSVDGSSLTTAVFGSSNVTAAPPSAGNGSGYSMAAMESSSGDLNFGSTSQKATPPVSFTFGTASSASTPAKSLAFTFGASTAKPPASTESGFTFGSSKASANVSASTPALSSSAFSMVGSSTTVSSSSAAPPTVTQQPGSFSFGSSSIAAQSTAPGFSFGVSSSSSGSAPAPSGFGAGGTTMGSFGVSTPGPFAFGGSAQNTAGTSFPAVAPAAFSFGSGTSSVSGLAMPAQTAPSFPSSSSGFGTTPALQQLGGSGGIPGGGFSLGTGGTSVAKGRRIVKAKRPNTTR